MGGRGGMGMSTRPTLLPLLLEKIPLFVLSLLSVMTTLWAQKGAIEAMNPMPLSLRLGNAVMAYGTYLFQVVWPVNLAIYYPVKGQGSSLWEITSVLILLVAISLLAIVARKRLPCLLVGWFWYLGMLVPVIGILKVGGQAYADRYTYLPTIGILIAVVWGVEEGTRNWRVRWQKTPVARGMTLSVTLAILLTLTALAWRQTSLWADNEHLWRHTIKCGESALAHNNLGETHFYKGETGKAEQEFLSALRLNPNFTEPMGTLGIILFSRDEKDAAMVLFERSVKAQPENAHCHFNLGHARLEMGCYRDAIAQLRETLRIDPTHLKARHDLEKAVELRTEVPNSSIDSEE